MKGSRSKTTPPLVGWGWGEGGLGPWPLTPIFLLALLLGFAVLTAAAPAWAAPIQDDRGREIALAAPPQRIVSLYGGLTEILIALGVKDRVVARTSDGGRHWSPVWRSSASNAVTVWLSVRTGLCLLTI